MVARVENLYVYNNERDLFVLAAVLLLSIDQAHGFNDANKRTSVASARVFLDINGVAVTPSDDLANYIVAAAQGLHDAKAVAAKLKTLCA
ncbi:type II toxin-antitoxin system death-on-curing family toxin [Erwinia mallotivora]|uniref:type II toxin-antitoxin system death-on-curing family toxin n=1 Tax=Erwinia mallotivora TaxID=69222 RepID=UPI0021C1CECB|nr:type II toxin-antitoxin system death-on-curing family toxin [Erwinia mallotivora]